MKLKLANDFALPAEAVTQTFAILARKRVGKTYTASVMAEEFVKASLPFVVLDPTGAWWGLRASADGKSEGYPVIVIGGAHGDVPLEEGAGKVIADLVVDHPGFYVIDLSATESNAAQDRFATDFGEHFYRRKEKSRAPMHLFVDEADSFAPQRPFPGQQRMLGAFEAIVRRGGIRGIGITLITQRPAVLNKNVLTQAEVLIALQMSAPQDQDAIEEWIRRNGSKEERDQMMGTLASLQRGEAWLWSPSWLRTFQKIHVRERTTFNSSATPEAGAKPVEPARLAPVDLAKLGERIAATVQRAKENDPGLLKRQLAELRKELKDLRSANEARPAKTTVKEKPVLKEGQLARVEKIAGGLAKSVDRLCPMMGEFFAALKAVAATAQSPFANLRAPTPPVPRTAGARELKPAARAERRALPPEHANGADKAPRIGGGLKRMLISLAQRPDGLSAKQLGVRAGLSSRSGTFGTYLGQLRANGWSSGDRGLIQITPEGRAALGEFEPLPVGSALFDYWRGEFGLSGASRLLEAIYNHGPLDAEAAAEAAGLSASSGTFGTYLGKLRSLELVSGSRDALKCAEELYD